MDGTKIGITVLSFRKNDKRWNGCQAELLINTLFQTLDQTMLSIIFVFHALGS
jgi:hypothetical protein